MKKIFSFFLVLILISISFSSFAESNLKRFERLLTGKWEWEAMTNYSYFSSANSQFDCIREFSFSKDESIIIRYGTFNNTVNLHDRIVGYNENFKANIYLTEDGSGCIYITIIVPDVFKFFVGNISFSDDGKTLLIILPTTGGTALYKKIN